VSRAVGLGYLGADIVLDHRQGPLLLEANARPGLAIQIANGQGLLPCFAKAEQTLVARNGN
jgi:D-alanine-D-alanine ligase-like ATP-grasp enzyme